MRKIGSFLLLALLASFLVSGCGSGGGGGNNNGSKEISLSIVPGVQTVTLGDKTTFTVNAKNTDFDVAADTDAGCAKSGNTVTCKPTKTGTYVITTSAKANTTITKTANLTVSSEEPQITVTPTSAIINKGDSITFTAKIVMPAGQPAQTAAWEASGTCGTINQKGVFQANNIGICDITASISGTTGQKISVKTTVQVLSFTTFNYNNDSKTDTYAYGINDSGNIVGSFVGSSDKKRGFLKNGSAYTLINDPAAAHTEAYKINNSGDIVGTTWAVDGNVDGFIKSGTDFLQLKYPGAYWTATYGINDSKTVVGNYETVSGLKGFLWNNSSGIYSTISNHPDFTTSTKIRAINNSGVIVGIVGDEDTGIGFIKSGDVFTNIRPIDISPNAVATYAYEINDSDQVVGYFIDSDKYWHGFLKSGNRYIVIDYPGADDTAVFGINNSGQIVGTFWDSAGIAHGFLLEGLIP